MKSASEFGSALRLVKSPASEESKPPKEPVEEPVAQAHLSCDAVHLEQNGFPFTAAIKWRAAAEFFADDSQLAERCWSEWERIMGLPRGFAWQAPQKQAA